MSTPNTVKVGDFKSLNLNTHSIEMLEDAYQAVTKANKWGFLRRPDVPGRPNEKFGFVPHFQKDEHKKAYADIDVFMEYDGHSGGSYAWVMRAMEYIAKNGWDEYVNSVGPKPVIKDFSLENFANSLEKNTIARALVPDLEKQIEGLRRYDKAVKDAEKDPTTWNQSAGFPYPCPCRKAEGREGWCGVAGFGVPACEH